MESVSIEGKEETVIAESEKCENIHRSSDDDIGLEPADLFGNMTSNSSSESESEKNCNSKGKNEMTVTCKNSHEVPAENSPLRNKRTGRLQSEGFQVSTMELNDQNDKLSFAEPDSVKFRSISQEQSEDFSAPYTKFGLENLRLRSLSESSLSTKDFNSMSTETSVCSLQAIKEAELKEQPLAEVLELSGVAHDETGLKITNENLVIPIVLNDDKKDSSSLNLETDSNVVNWNSSLNLETNSNAIDLYKVNSSAIISSFPVETHINDTDMGEANGIATKCPNEKGLDSPRRDTSPRKVKHLMRDASDIESRAPNGSSSSSAEVGSDNLLSDSIVKLKDGDELTKQHIKVETDHKDIACTPTDQMNEQASQAILENQASDLTENVSSVGSSNVVGKTDSGSEIETKCDAFLKNNSVTMNLEAAETYLENCAHEAHKQVSLTPPKDEEANIENMSSVANYNVDNENDSGSGIKTKCGAFLEKKSVTINMEAAKTYMENWANEAHEQVAVTPAKDEGTGIDVHPASNEICRKVLVPVMIRSPENSSEDMPNEIFRKVSVPINIETTDTENSKLSSSQDQSLTHTTAKLSPGFRRKTRSGDARDDTKNPATTGTNEMLREGKLNSSPNISNVVTELAEDKMTDDIGEGDNDEGAKLSPVYGIIHTPNFFRTKSCQKARNGLKDARSGTTAAVEKEDLEADTDGVSTPGATPTPATYFSLRRTTRSLSKEVDLQEKPVSTRTRKHSPGEGLSLDVKANIRKRKRNNSSGSSVLGNEVSKNLDTDLKTKERIRETIKDDEPDKTAGNNKTEPKKMKKEVKGSVSDSKDTFVDASDRENTTPIPSADNDDFELSERKVTDKTTSNDDIELNKMIQEVMQKISVAKKARVGLMEKTSSDVSSVTNRSSLETEKSESKRETVQVKSKHDICKETRDNGGDKICENSKTSQRKIEKEHIEQILFCKETSVDLADMDNTNLSVSLKDVNSKSGAENVQNKIADTIVENKMDIGSETGSDKIEIVNNKMHRRDESVPQDVYKDSENMEKDELVVNTNQAEDTDKKSSVPSEHVHLDMGDNFETKDKQESVDMELVTESKEVLCTISNDRSFHKNDDKSKTLNKHLESSQAANAESFETLDVKRKFSSNISAKADDTNVNTDGNETYNRTDISNQVDNNTGNKDQKGQIDNENYPVPSRTDAASLESDAIPKSPSTDMLNQNEEERPLVLVNKNPDEQSRPSDGAKDKQQHGLPLLKTVSQNRSNGDNQENLRSMDISAAETSHAHFSPQNDSASPPQPSLLRTISENDPNVFRTPSPPVSPLPPSPQHKRLTPLLSPLPITPQPEPISPLDISPDLTSPPALYDTRAYRSPNEGLVAPKPLVLQSSNSVRAIHFSDNDNPGTVPSQTLENDCKVKHIFHSNSETAKSSEESTKRYRQEVTSQNDTSLNNNCTYKSESVIQEDNEKNPIDQASEDPSVKPKIPPTSARRSSNSDAMLSENSSSSQSAETEHVDFGCKQGKNPTPRTDKNFSNPETAISKTKAHGRQLRLILPAREKTVGKEIEDLSATDPTSKGKTIAQENAVGKLTMSPSVTVSSSNGKVMPLRRVITVDKSVGSSPVTALSQKGDLTSLESQTSILPAQPKMVDKTGGDAISLSKGDNAAGSSSTVSVPSDTSSRPLERVGLSSQENTDAKPSALSSTSAFPSKTNATPLERGSAFKLGPKEIQKLTKLQVIQNILSKARPILPKSAVRPGIKLLETIPYKASSLSKSSRTDNNVQTSTSSAQEVETKKGPHVVKKNKHKKVTSMNKESSGMNKDSSTDSGIFQELKLDSVPSNIPKTTCQSISKDSASPRAVGPPLANSTPLLSLAYSSATDESTSKGSGLPKNTEASRGNSPHTISIVELTAMSKSSMRLEKVEAASAKSSENSDEVNLPTTVDLETSNTLSNASLKSDASVTLKRKVEDVSLSSSKQKASNNKKTKIDKDTQYHPLLIRPKSTPQALYACQCIERLVENNVDPDEVVMTLSQPTCLSSATPLASAVIECLKNHQHGLLPSLLRQLESLKRMQNVPPKSSSASSSSCDVKPKDKVVEMQQLLFNPLLTGLEQRLMYVIHKISWASQMSGLKNRLICLLSEVGLTEQELSPPNKASIW